MKLAEQIEHWECELEEKPWQNFSRSRKKQKRTQHKAWRHWSKQNLEDDSVNPTYNRYAGWEF